ncbi:MAG: hypothetical protein WC480_04880 [Patescibacteria group bacterium]
MQRVVILNAALGLPDPRWDIFVNGLYRGKMTPHERRLCLQLQKTAILARTAEAATHFLARAMQSDRIQFSAEKFMESVKACVEARMAHGQLATSLEETIRQRLGLSSTADLSYNTGLFGAKVVDPPAPKPGQILRLDGRPYPSPR